MQNKDLSREKSILNLIIRQANRNWGKNKELDLESKTILKNLSVSKADGSYIIETKSSSNEFKTQISFEKFKLYSTRNIDLEKDDPAIINNDTADSILLMLQSHFNLPTRIEGEGKIGFRTKLSSDLIIFFAILISTLLRNYFTELQNLIIFCLIYSVIMVTFSPKRKKLLAGIVLVSALFIFAYRSVSLNQDLNILNMMLVMNILISILVVRFYDKQLLLTVFAISILLVQVLLVSVLDYTLSQRVLGSIFLITSFLACSILVSKSNYLSKLSMLIIFGLIALVTKIMLAEFNYDLLLRILLFIFIEVALFVHQRRNRPTILISGLAII